MLIFLLLLLIVTVFGLHDLVPIFRDKNWRVFWPYITVIVFHLFVTVLIRLNVEIPSPAGPLKRLVSVIFGLN